MSTPDIMRRAKAYIKDKSPFSLDFDLTDVEIDEAVRLIWLMEWSFSRVQAFDDCPFAWYNTYILGDRGVDNAWSLAGTFCHELAEKVYLKTMPIDQLYKAFVDGFDKAVYLKFPFPAMKPSMMKKVGFYFQTYRMPKEILGVEHEFRFLLPNGMVFKGFIDLITGHPAGPMVVDHKISKPFAGEKLLHKRKQIHTYFLAIPLYFDKPAAAGYFHFFQTGTMVKVENDPVHVQQTLDWIVNTIEKIKVEREYKPILYSQTEEEQKEQLFFCRFICSHSEKCPALTEILGHPNVR